jgi:hypothetical protein
MAFLLFLLFLLFGHGRASLEGITLISPAGFDDFVRRVGQRMSGTVTPREPLTPDALRKIVEISREYGISIVDDAAL